MARLIEIDGRTGEGGGQLVRVAVGLAALTCQPVRITNVRGNRGDNSRAGLKNQHVAAIQFLAEATNAKIDGLSVGSHTVTFIPRRPLAELAERNLKIYAGSNAGSTLLILQAILPLLIFSGNQDDEPIQLDVSGGTNVAFSPSYEYFDQVLLPTLEENFGLRIERQLNKRSWSIGKPEMGEISLRVYPIQPGHKLQFKNRSRPARPEVGRIDVSIIIPAAWHEKLQEQLRQELVDLFPSAEVQFKIIEDSGDGSKWYILLVANSVTGGLRWGRDILKPMSRKVGGRFADDELTKARRMVRAAEQFGQKLSWQVTKDLYAEVSIGGHVDGFLQDQLVCFQALCDGTSSMPRGASLDSSPNQEQGSTRQDRAESPFGHGSRHAQTARWVVSQLLPVKFFNKGDIVEGAGFMVDGGKTV